MKLTLPAMFLSLLLGLSAAAQSPSPTRTVQATRTALSVTVPEKWESFTESPDDPTEVLFFQTPENDGSEVTVSFSVYPLTGSWEELIKRKNYQMLVFEDGPVTSNEALKLRGARGHKWVYEATDAQGARRLTYQLYLMLPPQAGQKRFLFMQAITDVEGSQELLPVFNDVARSLIWGVQAQVDQG